MSVCERERESARARERDSETARERESERSRERERERELIRDDEREENSPGRETGTNLEKQANHSDQNLEESNGCTQTRAAQPAAQGKTLTINSF